MSAEESEAWRARDRRALWHPYSRRSAIDQDPFPVIVRGEGIYLYDAEGTRYLDAMSSWWACPLGHSHPRLVRAITEQAALLQHSILGNLSHPPAIALAERLAALMGEGPRRVFFAGDGASAVEAALKIAVQYWHNRGSPERQRLVSLHNAYHGDTLGAVSVGYLERFHRPFQALRFPVHQVAAPFCGRCPWGRVPASCRLECFAPMRALFAAHGRELAAVIVEPLCQGAAGMRMYKPDYLVQLADLCAQTGTLLIVDEIAMGFGRTGRLFAFQHAGVEPDLVCVGKALSGGMLPISATVVKDPIYRTFDDQPEDHTFYHGHTFAGNPIAAAVAWEALALYEELDVTRLAATKGALLLERLAGLRALPGVADVRGLGLIVAVEVEDSAAPAMPAIRRRLFEQGILVRPLGNVVYLLPPLVTPDDVLLELADRLAAAVREALAQA